MDPEIYLLILLVLISGSFAGAELALFSLSDAQVRSLVDQKVRNAKLIAQLKSRLQEVVITISIIISFINTGSAALATILATEKFGSAGAGIATGIMSFLILFFGEIIPKSIAKRYAGKISLAFAPIFRLSMILLTPAIKVLDWLTAGTQKLLHLQQPDAKVSEEEVRALISLGQEEGALEANEREMIEKVFQLNDIIAEDVMTPDEYIVGFDSTDTLAEVLPIIQQTGYSRFPVFRVSGEVAGILYVKDVFNFLAAYTLGKEIEAEQQVLQTAVSELMQAAIFVPETKQADDLLREFQAKHKHIAIVVDEHGTSRGLVTLEDLIEEIVGEIADETDDDAEMIKQINDDSFEIDPRVSINEVNRICGTALRAPRHKSIGWLVLKTFRRIPHKGDSTTINDYKVIVQEADERRMKRLLMVRTAKARRRKQLEDSINNG